MTALTPTAIYGRAVWLGVNRDRGGGLESEAVETVEVGYEGFAGEAHSGLTRPSCTRVRRQYAKGTEIRNTRQVSIVATEELDAIGRALGLPEPVRPEWVGANLVLEGVPRLSQLSPSARLIFEGGASLVVDLENAPCRFPAEVIERVHPGKGRAFPNKAKGLRGVVAWVERGGRISLDQRCRLHLPPQRVYLDGAG